MSKVAISAAEQKRQKAQAAKTNALVSHLDATTGPLDPGSLSRSYGLELADVTKMLERRGRLQHGKLTVSC